MSVYRKKLLARRIMGFQLGWDYYREMYISGRLFFIFRHAFCDIHLIHKIVICTLQVRQIAHRIQQAVTYAIYSSNLLRTKTDSKLVPLFPVCYKINVCARARVSELDFSYFYYKIRRNRE